jgi:hypothetical protein
MNSMIKRAVAWDMLPETLGVCTACEETGLRESHPPDPTQHAIPDYTYAHSNACDRFRMAVGERKLGVPSTFLLGGCTHSLATH